MDIAEKLGKSQSTIANKIRLLKLPSDIQKSLLEENLTERHGRALLKLPDDELRRSVLKKILDNDLNVKNTEDLVEDILQNLRQKDEKAVKQNIKSLVNIRIYLNTLKKAYRAINGYVINAEYNEEDKGDHILVKIKLPKDV